MISLTPCRCLVCFYATFAFDPALLAKGVAEAFEVVKDKRRKAGQAFKNENSILYSNEIITAMLQFSDQQKYQVIS